MFRFKEWKYNFGFWWIFNQVLVLRLSSELSFSIKWTSSKFFFSYSPIINCTIGGAAHSAARRKQLFRSECKNAPRSLHNWRRIDFHIVFYNSNLSLKESESVEEVHLIKKDNSLVKLTLSLFWAKHELWKDFKVVFSDY